MPNSQCQDETGRNCRGWSTPLLIASSLSVLVLAVYGRSITFEFLSWDDDVHVTENPDLAELSWSNVGRFWTASYEGLYIPLSYTFFAGETLISRMLGGDEGSGRFHAGVFHAGSLALHCGCVLLVYWWLTRVLANRWSALAGAVFFAIHPLQTESVAWISETRGLLSALCSLVALCLAFTAIPVQAADGLTDSRKDELSAPRRLSRLRLALATAAFVLAMLAKPTAAALPVMLFVITVGLARWSWRKALAFSLPWLALAVLFALVTRRVQDVGLEIGAPLWARPIIAADAVSFYLTKLAAPWPLSIDYGRTPDRVLASTWGRVSWVVPLLLVLCLLRWRDRAVWSAFGIFIACLLPVLGLIPFAFQQTSTVADRYVYLAMLGPAFLVGWLLERFPQRWAVAFACCGIAMMGALAAIQTGVWRNDTTLYAHALDVNPGSAVSHNNLGVLALREGRLDEALLHFNEARVLDDHYVDAHYNYGLTLANQGRYQESLPAFERSISLDPERSQTHYDLGVALEQLGRTNEAYRHYVSAVRLEPDHPFARNNLGAMLVANGRFDAAIFHFQTAVRTEPEFIEARVNLGQAYLFVGRMDDAARQFEQALASGGNFPHVHLNLGLLAELQGDVAAAETHYAAALDAAPEFLEARNRYAEVLLQVDRVPGAVTEFQRVLAIDDRNVDAHNGLGRALRSLGDVPGSIEQFRAALALDGFSITAHRELAAIEEEQGNRDAALTRLRAAIEAAPPESDSSRNLQLLLDQLTSN